MRVGRAGQVAFTHAPATGRGADFEVPAAAAQTAGQDAQAGVKELRAEVERGDSLNRDPAHFAGTVG